MILVGNTNEHITGFRNELGNNLVEEIVLKYNNGVLECD